MPCPADFKSHPFGLSTCHACMGLILQVCFLLPKPQQRHTGGPNPRGTELPGVHVYHVQQPCTSAAGPHKLLQRRPEHEYHSSKDCLGDGQDSTLYVGLCSVTRCHVCCVRGMLCEAASCAGRVACGCWSAGTYHDSRCGAAG